VLTESSKETISLSAPQTKNPKKRKRDKAANEIDALFSASLGKRIKKAVLDSESKVFSTISGTDDHAAIIHSVKDRGLDEVLGAIRDAPKEAGRHGKKKRNH
jgi:nucleolar protein 9